MQKIPWKKIPWGKVGTLAVPVVAPIITRVFFEHFGLGELLDGNSTHSEDGGSAESPNAHHTADSDGAGKSAPDVKHGA